MPMFDWSYHQRCIAAAEFSTIVSSAPPTSFAPIVYETARLSSPAPSTSPPRSSLKRPHTSSSSEPSPERRQQPCKRAKPTTQPPLPIRLRLSHPRPLPTGIKLLLRNPHPAAKQARPIKLRLQNPAPAPSPPAPGRKPNKIWAFRLQGGDWCAATDNEHKAQWLREVFACGSWMRGMQESPPTGFLGAAAWPDDGGWQWEVASWKMELRPEDALGEGGEVEDAEE